MNSNIDTNSDINDKQENHIKTLYTNKAIKLLKICMVIQFISLATYVYAALVHSAFDFGFIFELISLAFEFFAFNSLEKYNFIHGKKYIIVAMLPLSLLIAYDFILLLINFVEVLSEVIAYFTNFDFMFYFILPYLFDIPVISIFVLLYKAYSSINRADGTKKAEDYVESFYENL